MRVTKGGVSRREKRVEERVAERVTIIMSFSSVVPEKRLVAGQ